MHGPRRALGGRHAPRALSDQLLSALALCLGVVGPVAHLHAQVPALSVTGSVRDSAGVPLAGVNVEVEHGRGTAVTDSSGTFWIDSMTAGHWTLRLRKFGFTSLSVGFTIPDTAQEDVELDDVVLNSAEQHHVTLIGIVRDLLDRSPVAGARISVGSTVSAYADTTGRFRGQAIVRGGAMVEVARLGYRPLRFELWPATDQDTVVLTIPLRPAAVPLAAIVVKGRRAAELSSFDQHRRAGFGTFLTAARIAQLPSVSAVDLLRWAGVEVRGNAFDDRGQQLSLFGAPYDCDVGGTGPVIFIDGRQWPTESAMAYLENTDPSELAGVEVYAHSAGLPVEYNVPDAECGVIAVWYRE